VKRYIAYYRVSTQKQGRSGLGLEAQAESVRQHAEQANGAVVATYTEVESGKRNDRPELAKALSHAKGIGATLVVAKLDRLSRNARFLLGLLESGVPIVFCDLPQINDGPTGKFLLTLLASVAELEAGMISNRVKAALGAYKARGGQLGASKPQCRNLTREGSLRGRQAGSRANMEAARNRDGYALGLIRERMAKGLSLSATARELAALDSSRNWSHVQVRNVLRRSEAAV
jgi:DNA invertase Pin-like site-specific DNA recombinase